MQAALAATVDSSHGLWIVAGYTVVSDQPTSTMGLSLRAPNGSWTEYPPLAPVDGAFLPSGDGWLAAAQQGGRAYYVSLLATTAIASATDEAGQGLALAVVDVRSGTPQIGAPRRIDSGDWPEWDEPTVAATRPPGATADTVLVAGTPIAPRVQDTVAVLVSHDGGDSFQEVAQIHAPEYPGAAAHGPANTLVRPFLQQDPRPGEECHAYLAFGVYYATALGGTRGIAPPACQSASSGCRSIAETETRDCGTSWSEPAFIAVDTGPPSSEDFRGFSYAVGANGDRYVVYADDTIDDTPVLLKRAPAGTAFSVLRGGRWDDGPVETLATGPSSSGGPVRRWGPALAAAGRVAAVWVEEDPTSHASALWLSTSDPVSPSWTAPQRVDDAGVACEDDVMFPSDDYMAVVPEGPFGSAASTFVVAWAPFAPCDIDIPRRVEFKTVP